MQTHALSAVRCPLKSYASVARLALAPRDLKILIVNEDMRWHSLPMRAAASPIVISLARGRASS